MTDKYIDPIGWERIYEDFKKETTEAGMLDFLLGFFPDWVIAHTQEYCHDYPHLQYNWHKICDQNKIVPKKIIIVDKVFFDLKTNVTHNLLMSVCEHLTCLGYVIRRREEFIGCGVCGRAIPDQQVYNLMKHKTIRPLPMVWSPKCSEC